MPRMTLWIPEIDDVPHSQPNGHITCNYWTTSEKSLIIAILIICDLRVMFKGHRPVDEINE